MSTFWYLGREHDRAGVPRATTRGWYAKRAAKQRFYVRHPLCCTYKILGIQAGNDWNVQYAQHFMTQHQRQIRGLRLPRVFRQSLPASRCFFRHPLDHLPPSGRVHSLRDQFISSLVHALHYSLVDWIISTPVSCQLTSHKRSQTTSIKQTIVATHSRTSSRSQQRKARTSKEKISQTHPASTEPTFAPS